MQNLEQKNEKAYYSIGEVSRIFDVNPSLLRFWEREFPQLKPYKNPKGTRYYTPADINTIRNIYYLVKEKGYTLEGAREKLAAKPQTVDRNAQIKASLENIKSFLQDIKNQLD